jgi:hypothetical protein
VLTPRGAFRMTEYKMSASDRASVNFALVGEGLVRDLVEVSGLVILISVLLPTSSGA